jgi:transcriptional regulator with XRE-family HTH domain
MADIDELYRQVGRKIRETRERSGVYSQEKLAKRLKLSRASVVNIEAGRQHAPLHVLWEIAEALGTDLVLLIPRREELDLPIYSTQLDESVIKQIEAAANGHPDTIKLLTDTIGRLKTTIETQRPKRKAHEQTRNRR